MDLAHSNEEIALLKKNLDDKKMKCESVLQLKEQSDSYKITENILNGILNETK